MILFEKQTPVLLSLVVFAAAGLQVYAAPVGSDRHYRIEEKHVSENCAPILSSTLVQLENVQDFVYGRLKTKTSFEFFDPVLRPLVEILDMAMNHTFPTTFVPKVEKVDTSSSPAQVKFGYIKDESDEYYIIGKAPWTEENEPKSLFKYRFRVLEKNLGVFLHVVKALPEPVRQELDSAGFLHDAQSLRTLARSLLTCEGVRHVTYKEYKELKEKFRGPENDESDQYIEMSEIMATNSFHHSYRQRIIFENIMMPMDPAQAALCCALWNVTKNDSPLTAVELSLDKQAIDPSSPLPTFVWSNEDMLHMAQAISTEFNYFERNEEMMALLFQD
ncbi:hypothetical protein BGZ83_001390 [Gryganskiella cystojenkinii]|nr:hypothetical protein BGZ83_001390 [Gryganskiella cystojenkinii]